MTKRRWLIGVAVISAVIFFWLRPGREVFKIPAGYKGPVVVFFNHSGGRQLPWDWGRRTYDIPRSGLLILKDDVATGTQVVEWVYVDAKGKAVESIPENDDAHPDLSATTVRVRSQRTHSAGDLAWFEAQIGIPAHPDSFGTPPHFLADEVIQIHTRGR